MLDPKFPEPIEGETEKEYRKRLRQAERDCREQGKEKFEKLREKFFKPLGVDFEPVLRPTKYEDVKPYQANQVAHIRLIETSREPKAFTNPKSTKAYKMARNKDGAKQAHRLYAAERFDLKPCWVVQAHAPSCVVKDPLTKNYILRKRMEEQIHHSGTAWKLEQYIRNQGATGHFSKQSFNHYRFWFFDIDYESDLEDLVDNLERMGLMAYVAVIVETSLNKYHIYFKSELVASTSHVMNWKESPEMCDKETYSVLKQKNVPPYARDWQGISLRGSLSPRKVFLSNVPLPEGVSDSSYLGDDESCARFHKLWLELNGLLKGDPKVCDEARVAQLPYYRNPKTGFMSRVVFANEDAEVLTLNTVAEAVARKSDYQDLLVYPDSVKPLEPVVRIHPEKPVVPVAYQKEVEAFNNRDVPVFDKIVWGAKQEERGPKETRSIEEDPWLVEQSKEIVGDFYEEWGMNRAWGNDHKRVTLPMNYAEYIEDNGLHLDFANCHNFDKETYLKKFAEAEDHAKAFPYRGDLWEHQRDVSGNSNKLLLVLSRFAYKYIDLSNEEEMDNYFDRVVLPCLTHRQSKDIDADKAAHPRMLRFRRRFKICCRSSKAKYNSIGAPTRPRMRGDFAEYLIDGAVVDYAPEFWAKLPYKQKSSWMKLISHIGKVMGGKVQGDWSRCGEFMEFQFFMPIKELRNKISGYSKKLALMEEWGFLERSKFHSYKYKKCRNWTLKFRKEMYETFEAKWGIKAKSELQWMQNAQGEKLDANQRKFASGNTGIGSPLYMHTLQWQEDERAMKAENSQKSMTVDYNEYFDLEIHEVQAKRKDYAEYMHELMVTPRDFGWSTLCDDEIARIADIEAGIAERRKKYRDIQSWLDSLGYEPFPVNFFQMHVAQYDRMLKLLGSKEKVFEEMKLTQPYLRDAFFICKELKKLKADLIEAKGMLNLRIVQAENDMPPDTLDFQERHRQIFKCQAELVKIVQVLDYRDENGNTYTPKFAKEVREDIEKARAKGVTVHYELGRNIRLAAEEKEKEKELIKLKISNEPSWRFPELNCHLKYRKGMDPELFLPPEERTQYNYEYDYDDDDDDDGCSNF